MNGCVHKYRAASLAPVVAVGGVMCASHHAMTKATATEGVIDHSIEGGLLWPTDPRLA
jgi:hypothetical protein